MAKNSKKITVEIYPPRTMVWVPEISSCSVSAEQYKISGVEICEDSVMYALGSAEAPQDVVFTVLGDALLHAANAWESQFGKESKP